MNVTYFRPPRLGPENIIENAVVKRISNLFPSNTRTSWIGGSLPIGAGIPDLIIVSCEPKVTALAQVDIPSAHILAYIRATGKSTLKTIIEHIGKPQHTIVGCLDRLIEAGIVLEDSDFFSLSRQCREVLTEIITIEVKISDWKKALLQAERNKIFAHRSFIALPQQVADRVSSESLFDRFGIGLISVNEDFETYIVREAHCGGPCVWTYYYQLASVVARNYET